MILTGEFRDTVDFGGGPLVSAGREDIFVAKYDAGGNHQWSRRFGADGDDSGLHLDVGASGEAIVTGYFHYTVDFGGGPLVSAGTDIFLAKYEADGTHEWSHRFGGGQTAVGLQVATDASGNLTITGYFQGTVDFGGGALVSAGRGDVFIARYDARGVHRWSQRFGSNLDDWGQAVTVNASGSSIVSGFFKNTVDFGGGPLVSAGENDVFLAKYSEDGVYQ